MAFSALNSWIKPKIVLTITAKAIISASTHSFKAVVIATAIHNMTIKGLVNC